jgi:hypothetical protein
VVHPASCGAGEFIEPEPVQQRQTVLVRSPRIAEQSVDVPEGQPVRGLGDQPAGPAPAECLLDVQVADVGLAVQSGQPAAVVLVGVHLAATVRLGGRVAGGGGHQRVQPVGSPQARRAT